MQVLNKLIDGLPGPHLTFLHGFTLIKYQQKGRGIHNSISNQCSAFKLCTLEP